MLKTQILFLGEDSVGKTTLLYLLKLNEKVFTLPTIGFNTEDIEYKKRKIRIYDIGGEEKYRNLWNFYIKESKCIVYILNISDKGRLDCFIKCFDILLKQYKDFRNIPIIIFGNIFNDKVEFEPEEFLQKINLPPEISPHIIKGNIIKGEGFPELLNYIYNNIEFKEEENEKNEKYEEKEGIDKNEVKIKEKEEYKVVMFGLDNSGKTTILYLLNLGEELCTLPTLGYNVESINNKNWEKCIRIWDCGGQKKFRKLWGKFLNDIHGIIWVYDLSNNETNEESQNKLKNLLDNPEINPNKPLLIYANKSDLNENANKIENFINGIQDYLVNRPYFIKECNKTDLESYKEGLDWLYNNII